MLRLKAFHPSLHEVVKIQLHPWIWLLLMIQVESNDSVGAKLENLAEGEVESRGKLTETIRGGSVKQVNFYDDDVRFWQNWHNHSSAAEAPTAVHTYVLSSLAPSTKGRHFLVIYVVNTKLYFWTWSRCVSMMYHSKSSITSPYTAWSSFIDLVLESVLLWLLMHLLESLEFSQ